MNEKFLSEQMQGMRSNIIRELLSFLQQDVISFAGGAPDPKTFPRVENFQEAVEYALTNYEKAFQYGTTEGLPSFRKQIAAFMLRMMSVKLSPENIVVSVGSQESLDVIARLFLDRNSWVAVELPTYIAALQVFNIWKPRYITVPTDKKGMDVHALEKKLRRLYSDGGYLKFVYTIPTGHNPLGSVMPLDRRKHLLELADRYDFYIVEDDPYGFITYDRVPPRLITLDGGDRVIYISTFSKIFAPGFRLGWLAGPEEVVRRVVIAKQGTTLCAPPFNQFVVEYFLRNRWIDSNIERIREIYSVKRDAMAEAMREYMPSSIDWVEPDAGFFFFTYLPRGLDAMELLYRAIEEVKVAYVPGEGFYADGSGKNTLRLSFSLPTPDTIREGVKRLGMFFEKVIREAGVEVEREVMRE